ncbi:hypothetical protein [Brevundimonas sp.]|uniref:hypothetical protein n=1 Tax=Brevundimonas sp. TaxID=1871086 RepID=UPI002D4150D9|nr:hypothetical protein [Brevundimonas sp.]HYC98582.1 hypothetical protein [Brevundimonas sp.]
MILGGLTVTEVPDEPYVLPYGAISEAFGMTGWSALTNGTTKGGAVIVRLRDGQGRIVVRAQDDSLNLATIDLLNPGGPLSGAAWVDTGLHAGSEPHCQALLDSESLGDMACLFVNRTSKSVNLYFLDPSGHYASPSYELGGHNPGFRPTLLPRVAWWGDAPFVDSELMTTGYEALAWDGGVSGWRLSARFTQKYMEGAGLGQSPWGPAVSTQPGVPDQWTQMHGAYPTPLDCIEDNAEILCAVGTLTGQIRVIALQEADAGEYVSAAPVQRFVTSAVPNGLSINIAPSLIRLGSGHLVVTVRGEDGHIWQVRIRPGYLNPVGPWIDEGGYTRAGSGISCIANNEEPTCFAQGMDGRIYWKKFATASGL